MSDFEDRLTRALHSAGDDAPDGLGLAGAARRRDRVRRRRTALTSAAAVVAVVGVVGGVAVLGDRDSRAPQVTDTPTTPVPSEPSKRVETWRDVGVTVPVSWAHGSLDDWCANDGRLGEPVVERPGGASVDILCDPQLGYGVQFSDGAAFDAAEPPGKVWQYTGGDVRMYPEGAWLGYQRTDHAMAFVSAATRAEAELVLGSFGAHGDSDPDGNGCLIHPPAEPTLVPPGQVRLCRYGLDDWLEQSEVLTGQDAADAVAALESAPAKDDRMCTMALTGPRILVTSSDAQGWVTLDACQGFSWDGAEHDLTADVLYWVLSPGWSGSWSTDELPVPDKFRQ